MFTERQDESKFMNPAGGYRAALTSDQAFANATGGTAAAITGFAFPIKQGQLWIIEATIRCLGVSGGGKFSVSGPASPNLLSLAVRGLTSGITAYSTDVISALDTLSAAYNTSAVTGDIFINGVFSASADGTIQFNAANVTNSNSFAVKAGSWFNAWRVA